MFSLTCRNANLSVKLSFYSNGYYYSKAIVYTFESPRTLLADVEREGDSIMTKPVGKGRKG